MAALDLEAAPVTETAQRTLSALVLAPIVLALVWLGGPFYVALLLVGAASIASVMFANVMERRKEIGTLMALGASRKFVTRLFLGKAALMGLTGGVGGFVAGTILAAVLGPQLLGVHVQPMPHLLAIGMMAATIVAVTASFLPARRASRLDPCLVFNDA